MGQQGLDWARLGREEGGNNIRGGVCLFPFIPTAVSNPVQSPGKAGAPRCALVGHWDRSRRDRGKVDRSVASGSRQSPRQTKPKRGRGPPVSKPRSRLEGRIGWPARPLGGLCVVGKVSNRRPMCRSPIESIRIASIAMVFDLFDRIESRIDRIDLRIDRIHRGFRLGWVGLVDWVRYGSLDDARSRRAHQPKQKAVSNPVCGSCIFFRFFASFCF